MKLAISLVLLTVVLATTNANAQAFGDKGDANGIPLNGNFSAPGSHPQRLDNTVYRVDFKCTKIGQLPKTVQKNFFSEKTITSSHGIILGLSDAPTINDKKLKVPEKPLALFVPYELDGPNVLDKRLDCPQPRLIFGTEAGYVFPYASYSEKNAPGYGFAAVQKLVELVSPLFAIFQPAALPAAVASKLSAVKDTKGPIEGIFSLFDNADTYGTSFPLNTGRYIIRTTYSEIEIGVSKLDSIVDAKPSSLQAAFRKHIDTAEAIKPAEVYTNCSAIAAALKNIGFSEEKDIPYALTYASTKIGSRPKMVECLGDDYTSSAIALGPVLWKWIPGRLTLTQAYIDDLQPTSFSGAKPRLLNFIVAMSRVARGDSARSAEGLDQLKTVVAENVLILDKTQDGLWPPPSQANLSSTELANRFTSKGFIRFGCMAPLGEGNGVGSSSSVASLLAIKPRAKPSDADEAVQLQAVFKKGLISQLHVFNDSAWILKNAAANDGYCPTIKLDTPGPATTSSPEPKDGSRSRIVSQ